MPSAAALTDAAADAAGGGDLDSALALVRRALSLEPQSVPALVCLGNVLAERGDASGAATAYGVAPGRAALFRLRVIRAWATL